MRTWRIEIAHNRIADIGAGGIRIGHFFSWEEDGRGMTERGRQRKATMPTGPPSQRVTVADNEIAHCGRFTPETVSGHWIRPEPPPDRDFRLVRAGGLCCHVP